MVATIGFRNFFLFVRYLKHKDYATQCIILSPLHLCGCDIWSLTLWEDHRPRVLENRALRKIVGAYVGEGTWN